ncbi:thermostable hemolysin [Pseudomonas sp. Leaf58]|uniref:thermostable hemolysin n=1 Tax=Pseudomonas sp. Leaf58 TaxID=1736226 RepID=UPI0006F36474|nr:thermostable hemolysin [Pseudomonas sp. Leaf58]AYG45042.1 thermostable hemolysin [Pseudomonas sp. Leaf58]KQN65179.1 thermostable hemolysin [Pseudomonas sp. Leaf58]
MTQYTWSNLLPLPIGSHIDHHACLSLLLHGDPKRGELEQFIHQCFATTHHADIHHFLPELLALHDSHGRLIAAAGMRPASSGLLFLEHYLDEPVESAVSRIAGQPLERESVVEVGNLASLSAGSARIMIIAVTWLLATRGLRWVVFTGASTLINSFQRLGLVPHVLAEADPARLNEPAEHWGSYYAQHPQVFVGDIRYGFDRLNQAGVFQRLGLPVLSEETGHAA